ncbi:MAG TPA: DUF4175 family protein [Planctomycetota bacterium]|jgi:hypothetical protein
MKPQPSADERKDGSTVLLRKDKSTLLQKLRPSAVAAQRLEVPVPVATALRRFADASRRLAVWASAAWTIAALVLLFTVIALADRFQLIDDSGRRASALLAYVCVLGLLSALLFRALRRRTPAEIALVLESRISGGDVKERISTTVELAERSQALAKNPDEGNEGVSTALIGRVADEAAALVQGLKIEDLPESRPALRAGKAAAALLGAMLALCILPSLHMATLYARALVPWRHIQRPSNTRLAVLPGDSRVVEGAAIDVEAQLSGQPANSVFVETREKGAKDWNSQIMERSGEHEQRFTLKVGPMRAGLDYRVRAGDGLSPEYRITVLPRPEIAGLSITVRYPAYTKMPPETFERLTGDLSVLKGSRVSLNLKSSTALSAAVLEFSDERKISMAVEKTVAKGGFEVTEDSQYRVQLRSDEGVCNPDAPLFAIRAIPDCPPQVTVITPVSDETVDPARLVTLESRAEDDFGITSMRLVVRSEQTNNSVTLALQKPADADKIWLVAQPWDLAGLFLRDGDTVTYRVEATDTAGTVGKSDERRMRVSSGRRAPSAAVLAALEKAQSSIANARKLLASTKKDVNNMRQLFRPEDTGYQAAERLLLGESIQRVARQTQNASEVLGKVAPDAEAGPFRALLTALSGALTRYATSELRPLDSAAIRARSQESPEIARGLETLVAQAPLVEERLALLHNATTVGQRYAGSMLLEDRAAEIRDWQQKITPVLVGAAGWSARGAYTPGLTAEYYRGGNFETLVRRTVENRFELKNKELPDLGRENFSIRWKGQMLAPKAGRYVFRTTADDGVRLTLDANRIIDEWRGQNPTTFEGSIELTEGWHDIVFEFYQGTGTYEINLLRAGPRIASAPIPPEHLRNAAALIGPATDSVRAAMASGATESAVDQALVRMQTMIQAAQNLSPELTRLAMLPPEPDGEALKQSGEWRADVTRCTIELQAVKSLSPPLALPIGQWQEHTAVLARRYVEVRARYRRLVEEWLRKLSNEVFAESAKMKQMQANAEAAKKAFEKLTEASRQQKDDERRAAEMAKADAVVRAMAEEMQTQAKEIAADLKKEAEDGRRPLEERRLIEALEHKAEMLAVEPLAGLQARLEEAKTPEALAKTQDKWPNAGAQAQEVAQRAAELAQATEKMERAVALREELKDTAKNELAAKEALTKPATAENAAAQERAASELKEEAADLKQALENARNQLDPNTIGKAQQASDQAANSKAPELLEKKAAQTLAGETQPKPEDAAKAKEAAKELGEQAKQALDAASAINKELANAAQQLNGDPAQALRQAAQDLAVSSQKLAEAKQPQNTPAAMEQAAEKAAAAQERADHTAERLGLDAEAARKDAKTPEQKAKADDLVRLAAAVNHEADKQLAPLAADVNGARNEPNDAAQNKELQKREKGELEKLNKLADIAGQIASQDPNQQKQAREALNKVLAEQGEQDRVEAALKNAAAMEKVAEQLAKNDAAQVADQNRDREGAAKEKGPTDAEKAANLDAAEKTLAQALGADPQQAAREAMGKRLDELAKDLRQQAGDERQLANHLSQAAALEQQAREDLKKEAPAMAQALQGAQKEAAADAQGKSPDVAQPLKNAEQQLGKAAENAAAEAAKADAAPLPELGKDMAALAQQIEKPAGELAAAMSKAPEEQMKGAQQAGREARETAGKAAELAQEMQNAARAGELAKAEAKEDAGDRQQLEAQAHAAIDALEKEGGAPAAELAALKKAAEAPQAGQQPQGKADGETGRRGDGEKGQEAGGGKQEAGATAQGEKDGGTGRRGEGEKKQEAGGGKQESGGEQSGTPGGALANQEPRAKSQEPGAAEQARAEAERLTEVAAQMEKLAAAMTPAAPAANAQQNGQTAAEALQQVAGAEAAQQTGAPAEAGQMAQQAEQLLAQAAEAARAQATGAPAPSPDSQQANGQQPGQKGEGKGQAQAQGKDKGQGKSQGKNQGQGNAAKGAFAAQSKGALAPEPPAGLPIDKATWNRLPDDMRRDLLNAAGGRFPAEYEASIKRYFKNVAAVKKDENK